MGSKGGSPRPTKTTPLPTPQPEPQTIGGEGGSGRVTPDDNCWDFQIVSTTQAAAQAKRGMGVNGVPEGSRVMIHADVGVLGYAPAGVSKKMIAAIRKTGSTLGGYVLSGSGSQHGILVKLCLS